MKAIKNIQEINVTGLVNGMAFKTNPNSEDTFIYSEGTELNRKTVFLVTYVTEKIYTDYNGNEVSLTENEKEIIELLDEVIFEYGTIVYLDELNTTFSTKVARGVLSSLIKKNVCCIHEGMIGYSMDKFNDFK